MKYKKIGLFAASFALVASMFSGVVLSPLASAAAQTCVWTGTAADNKLSTPGNWTGCGSAAPQAGDAVTFNYADITDQQVLTNDLGVALGNVTFNKGSSGSPSKTIVLTALQLAEGASVGMSGTNGDGGAAIYVGIAPVINSEWVNMGNLTGLGALTLKDGVNFKNIVTSGVVTVARGGSYGYNAGDSFSGLIIDADASAYFSATDVAMTFDKPITLNGGQNASLKFDGICKTSTGFSCSEYSPTTWTVSGPITVNTASMIDTVANTTVIFTGAVSDKTRLSSGYNAEGMFRFGANAEVIAKTTVAYDGDQSTNSETVLSNQIGILSGKRSSVTVVNGGVLKGTGSVQYSLFVQNGGVIAPGMSPGCLTANTTLTLDGEYQFELGGVDPCTGYDQIKVMNSSNIANAVSFNSARSVLTTSRYNGYTPKKGQVFTIIDQAGAMAVQSTFKNLPEGATFTQNGIVFKISYVGGDGNDVTLTVMNSPTAPDTGFLLLQSNAALVAIIVATAAVAMVMFGRKLQPVKR